ncbi:Alpha/Beta hydrolase protein [Chaetomidium leptoderma]|uniref:Alpha/Beta hydrolase protein n=1 Tax=Chaetomidium leptoderma TaxID=669021 RepID=A0AAN6VRN8_9PEZI|nr:Alpha/Beta hydrolase protein [Chaetomidium leptoderma]
MNLGPVSYLDCIVFCVFLAPQLVWRVGFIETVLCVLQALPFVLVKLPVAFIHDRILVTREKQSAFLRRASLFEDLVVRCVRYAFANIPPRIGRVFFAKEVALPFLWFRLLRHGYLASPIHWSEHRGRGFRGIWLSKYPREKPDFVLFYAHGGGFSMGSSYFYLEYLLTWLSVLSSSGYGNPAIFALEYTLVPDASFPTQIDETLRGYEHVLAVAQDPSIVCVSGDSAGATLILCLLLRLGDIRANGHGNKQRPPMPALAVLISPWVTLVSARHTNTASDYLDAQQLSRYGTQFAGNGISVTDPSVSPGCCKDISWWKRSSPSKGMLMTYGTEEVLAPEMEGFIDTLREADVMVESKAEPGGIHAWPVASLFLSSSRDERLRGLVTITREIRQPSRGKRLRSGAVLDFA